MGDCTEHPVTVLPRWLDEYIYQANSSEFGQFHDRFMARDLPQDELSGRYLGTYFPRSYAESRSIFTSCLSSRPNCLKDKTEVSILDFGCGTGGDLFGLIDTIMEYRPSVQKFTVLWCDSSNDACSVFRPLLARWRQQNPGKMLSGRASICEVHAIDDYQKHANAALQLCPGGCDIVTSFKAINEVYQGGYNGQPYKEFYDVFWPLVKIDGVFCVEDLTFRHPNDPTGEWMPNLLGKIPLEMTASPVNNSVDHHRFPVQTSCNKFDGQKVAFKLFVKDGEPLDWSF